jgi:hypothetical protein
MKRVNELPSAQRRAFKVDAFCDTYEQVDHLQINPRRQNPHNQNWRIAPNPGF